MAFVSTPSDGFTATPDRSRTRFNWRLALALAGNFAAWGAIAAMALHYARS